MHSHSDFTLLEDGNAQSKIRQGVTTEVARREQFRRPVSRTSSSRNAPWSAASPNSGPRSAGYFDLVEKSGISTNVASFVGLGTIWQCVMGVVPPAAHAGAVRTDETPGRRGDEQRRVRPVHLPWPCRPTRWPPPTTSSNCAKSSPATAAFIVTHIRNEGTESSRPFKEAIAIGRRAGITVEILHIKIADQLFWGRMNDVVKLIDDARKEGINVGANVYPYTRGNNNLSSIIPPWAHEGGTAKMLQRLKDPQERIKLKKDIKEGIPGWYNHYTAVGGDWGRMLISAKSNYQGLTMDKILASRTKDKTPPGPPRRVLRSADRGRRLGVHGLRSSHRKGHEPGHEATLVLDRLGRLGARHRRPAAARQSAPAQLRHLPARPGRLCPPEGLAAPGRRRSQDDLAERHQAGPDRPRPAAARQLSPTSRSSMRSAFIDRATYTDPFQYNEGIEYVIVNGQLVLDQGKHTGARPGRALRRNVVLEEKK